jgi:hypothetical protein
MTSTSINQNLIVKTYEHNGVSVDVSFTGDAFFNATAAAKAFGKMPKDWLVTSEAKEYIEASRRILLLEQNQMVIVNNGGNNPGTWLHPKLAIVFARWVNVDFALWCDGIIESILKGESGLMPQTVAPAPDPRQVTHWWKCGLVIAKSCGFKGAQALLSADRAVKAQVGLSALALIGHAQLQSETQTLHYTPTEIGQMLNPPLSAIKTNVALAAVGLQEKVVGRWTPTAMGQPHAVVMDTGKRHSDGTPVEQVKWAADVLGILCREEAA